MEPSFGDRLRAFAAAHSTALEGRGTAAEQAAMRKACAPLAKYAKCHPSVIEMRAYAIVLESPHK